MFHLPMDFIASLHETITFYDCQYYDRSQDCGHGVDGETSNPHGGFNSARYIHTEKLL